MIGDAPIGDDALGASTDSSTTLTVSCAVGTAGAAGARATLLLSGTLTIGCSPGTAAATGRTAAIALAPRGPMSFVPSKSRTLKVLVGPDRFEGGPGWDLTDPTRPIGIKDPDSVIDVTLDWTDVMADITDTIDRCDYLVSGGLTDAGHYADGMLTTVFVGGGTDPEMEITFRATTASVPSRILDRTIVLRRVQQ
jgi:hypothetical protein